MLTKEQIENSPLGESYPIGIIITEKNLKEDFERAKRMIALESEGECIIKKKNGKEIRITEETTFEEVERA